MPKPVDEELKKPDGTSGEVSPPVAAPAPNLSAKAETLAQMTRRMLLSGRRYSPGQEWLKEAAELGADKQVTKVLAAFTEEQQLVIANYLTAVS